MKWKRSVIYVACVVAMAVCSSASRFENNTIKGFVSPADAAVEVWATSPEESLRVDVTNGNFELNGLKQGTYNIRIQAIAPYEGTSKEGIRVEDGEQVNLGEIKLEKSGGF